MKIKCTECRNEFNRTLSQIKRSENNFCSRTCSSKFNNRGKHRNIPKDRICKKCGDTYHTIGEHRSTHFCQDCSVKTHNKPEFTKTLALSEFFSRKSVEGKHPSWRFVHVRNLNRQWNANLRELPCANCGYTKHVELAHRKAIKDFHTTATLGEVNAPGNNVQLCPNCHWEFDNGLLSI